MKDDKDQSKILLLSDVDSHGSEIIEDSADQRRPKFSKMSPTSHSRLFRRRQNKKHSLQIQNFILTEQRFKEKTYKYLPVWKRALFKIKIKKILGVLNEDIILYGTSSDFTDINNNYKENLDVILKKKQQHLENFRIVEDESRIPPPFWLIHPDSVFKKIWTIILTFLLAYTALIMPYRMAFHDQVFFDAWTCLEITIDGLFFIDIIVNMFSTYLNRDNEYERSLRKIFWNYFKSWMIFDLFACIPFSLIDYFQGEDSTGDSGDYNEIVRLARVPRIYRLLRVSRIFKVLKTYRNSNFFSKIQDFFQVNTRMSKLIGFILTVLICIHVMGCFWFFTARIQYFNPDTWPVRYGIINQSDETIYISCIYWAMTTLTTVGFGDITPGTDLERIVTIIWMCFGVGFYSFTVGSLSSVLQSMDTRESVLTTKLYTIHEFANDTGLDLSLKQRLRNAIRYNSQKVGIRWEDKMELFNELPKKLRYSISMNMYQGAAQKIPFLQDKDASFISMIMTRLKPLNLIDGEYVYMEDSYADEMYFLLKGRINYVVTPHAIVFKSFIKGSYFGEIEILNNIPRQDDTMAFGNCELLVLSKVILLELLEDFPYVKDEMQETAKQRSELNYNAKQLLLKLLDEKQNSLQEATDRKKSFDKHV